VLWCVVYGVWCCGVRYPMVWCIILLCIVCCVLSCGVIGPYFLTQYSTLKISVSTHVTLLCCSFTLLFRYFDDSALSGCSLVIFTNLLTFHRVPKKQTVQTTSTSPATRNKNIRGTESSEHHQVFRHGMFSGHYENIPGAGYGRVH
jgi:hypothetical protein